jgi:hypothetical protein
MPQGPTNNTPSRMTAHAQSNHEADTSPIQGWEAGLKPSRMRGYSLSAGHRRTRAMWPTPKRIGSPKLTLPAWHRPYGEALLTTDPETRAKLLADTEQAIFMRLLELTALGDASDERRDLGRAIDVMRTLKLKT